MFWGLVNESNAVIYFAVARAVADLYWSEPTWSSRDGAGQWARGGVFLQVAEKGKCGRRWPNREVYVFGLHDYGARGPSPRVADVSEGDINGV